MEHPLLKEVTALEELIERLTEDKEKLTRSLKDLERQEAKKLKALKEEEEEVSEE